MRPRSWRMLHLVGTWYFWAAIWVSYAGVLLTGDFRIVAIVYVIVGAGVLAVRVVAYLKDRSMPELKHS